MEAAGEGTISTGIPSLSPEAKSPAVPSLGQQLWQCVCVAVLATASYFFISHFFLESVQVVGRSMSPTLEDSSSYLLNRWVYYLRSPRRQDVVVLRDPADRGCAVKRIIGAAGDTVSLRGGYVYVNGHQMEEPYLAPRTRTYPFGADEQTFLCGKDQYFVLGDNRANSADSRSYGVISRSRILGVILK